MCFRTATQESVVVAHGDVPQVVCNVFDVVWCADDVISGRCVICVSYLLYEANNLVRPDQAKQVIPAPRVRVLVKLITTIS